MHYASCQQIVITIIIIIIYHWEWSLWSLNAKFWFWLNEERSIIAMKWKSQSKWYSLINVNALDTSRVKLRLNYDTNKTVPCCFVEIVTTSRSINELNYFPNCDTLQARQPFGNYSVLLYLYFTVIIFLIRLLCVTYRFRTTLTKNKQQFETHGFGCVSQQNTCECSWDFYIKL